MMAVLGANMEKHCHLTDIEVASEEEDMDADAAHEQLLSFRGEGYGGSPDHQPPPHHKGTASDPFPLLRFLGHRTHERQGDSYRAPSSSSPVHYSRAPDSQDKSKPSFILKKVTDSPAKSRLCDNGSRLSARVVPSPTKRISGDVKPPVRHIIELTVDKMGGMLGFSISAVQGGPRQEEHYIKSLVPGGPAEKGGHLEIGDKILEINGITLDGMPQETVVDLIRTLDTVHLKVEKNGAHNNGVYDLITQPFLYSKYSPSPPSIGSVRLK